MAFDENVPVSTNTMAADIAAIKENWKFVVSGLQNSIAWRMIEVEIYDGSNANTLSCQIKNVWNGDTDGPTDNVAKGATTGNYTLQSGGLWLTIEAAALTGNATFASVVGFYNASGTRYHPNVLISSNDLVIYLFTNVGASVDLTSVVDSGNLELFILYFTDA